MILYQYYLQQNGLLDIGINRGQTDEWRAKAETNEDNLEKFQQLIDEVKYIQEIVAEMYRGKGMSTQASDMIENAKKLQEMLVMMNSLVTENKKLEMDYLQALQKIHQ